MAKILVIHGPNLNLLGTREPEQYGQTTLAVIDQQLEQLAQQQQQQLESFQSNSEGDLVTRIQRAGEEAVDFIIINPAAYGHTSIALRDALLAVAIPFIEVHLTNIQQREEFRQHTFLADIAVGSICGFAAFGYELALLAANDFVNKLSKG